MNINNLKNIDNFMYGRDCYETPESKRENQVTNKTIENSNNDADTVTLSGNVKRHEINDVGYYQQMAEVERERSKEGADSARIMSKCMLIASRLTSGDKVPLKDERFLQKHDMKLYLQAMKMRIPKQEPREWDSISDDEEEPADELNIGGENAEGIAEDTADSNAPVDIDIISS